MRRVFRPAIPTLCSGDKTLLYNTMFLRCLTVLKSILAGLHVIGLQQSLFSAIYPVVSHIIVRNLQKKVVEDVKTEMYDGKMKREIERPRNIYIIYYTRERKNIVN